jgi:hypothetical protein
MEFWLAQVTEIPVAIASLAVKAKQEPVAAAMQPVARRPVAEHRPEQAKPEPDSAKRLLGLEAAAWRWDRLAQAFVAPVRQLSISWRAQLGCERRLCSYRSSRK